MSEGILIDGKYYDLRHPKTNIPIPVFGPEDHKMEFRVGEGWNKPRKEPIDLAVWHWTGSENAVETMYRVLNNRKLGVEFAISPLGSVFQFCDPAKVDTADAGWVNARSIGVEIVNAGVRRLNTLWREPRTRKPKLGPRMGYDTRIHGVKLRCWDFYPWQTYTALALAKVFSDAIPTLPARVAPGASVDIPAMKEFTGHCGHYHVSRKKTDPGTEFIKNLRTFFDGELPDLSGQEALVG